MRCALGSLLALSLGLILGCESAPTIAPGASAVRLSVQAKPKAGAPLASSRVYVYDTPLGKKPHGDYEQVDYSDVNNIVVWLEPSAASKAVPAEPVHVGFLPGRIYGPMHAACVGQKLMLHNRSSHAEKLYSVSDGNEFETPIIAPDAMYEYTVRNEGPIEILADSTKEPVANVYAAKSSFVAEAHSGQVITFTDVPPGPCKIIAWHPRLPGAETTTTLVPNQLNNATIQIGVNSLPKVY